MLTNGLSAAYSGYAKHSGTAALTVAGTRSAKTTASGSYETLHKRRQRNAETHDVRAGDRRRVRCRAVARRYDERHLAGARGEPESEPAAYQRREDHDEGRHPGLLSIVRADARQRSEGDEQPARTGQCAGGARGDRPDGLVWPDHPGYE